MPRSANVEANSQPIAPPPMTATRAGSVVEIEHLVAGHDRAAALEAGDQPGHRPGGEDARASPVIVVVDPSPPVHRDACGRARARPCR